MREVSVGVNESASLTLINQLYEAAGQELALALAGESDDVLVGRDLFGAEPVTPAEQG
jgi:hypothetical protein